MTAKTVYYASVGPALTLYDIDVDNAALTRRSSLTLPANIQYAWPHPSRRFLYVVSSSGGPGISGDKHFASALAVDPATGALRLHGDPVTLPSRPIHTTVDAEGAYLFIAYNDPSNITVHRLGADGAIGPAITQPNQPDAGIFAHQVRVAPGNRIVMLVTRGNNAGGGKPEDPGAIKTYAFDNGVLTNLASITPGNGLGFGPRHLDFHPTKPWAFISVERQNKLYVSNRTFPASGPGARQKTKGGENSVVVFAIDQTTGEPMRLQNLDGRGLQLRTFGIDPTGRLLVVASIMSAADGTLPAGITVMRISADGRLGFVRKYDVDVGDKQQFWTGMVTLP